MRLPRGENSRDDAEDRDLDDEADVGRINIEEAFMDRYKDPTPGRRSVGPDIDTNPSYGGKFTSKQVMMKFPKAARAWVMKLRPFVEGTQEELLDMMDFRVDQNDNNTLYADPCGEDGSICNQIWRWDDNEGWESLSEPEDY